MNTNPLPMTNPFEEVGTFKEYFVNNKFQGMVLNPDCDVRVRGFYSRKEEILSCDVILANKKVLSKGTEVTTFIQTLCGKFKREKNESISS